METFRIIEGFANYSVSDHGNVKNNKTERVLKSGTNTSGYPMVVLMKDRKMNTCVIHRLVANAFILNPENKKCVDHIDNHRSNNNLNNLRWATVSENSQNKTIHKNSKSRVKGVYFHKASQKYEARISIDGIKIHLGLFTNIEDAKQARMIKANQAFGFFTNACEKII